MWTTKSKIVFAVVVWFIIEIFIVLLCMIGVVVIKPTTIVLDLTGYNTGYFVICGYFIYSVYKYLKQ